MVAAPEIFNRQYDGKKVDVWASGVMLYAMLFARYPFAGPPKEPTQDFVARYARNHSGVEIPNT